MTTVRHHYRQERIHGSFDVHEVLTGSTYEMWVLVDLEGEKARGAEAKLHLSLRGRSSLELRFWLDRELCGRLRAGQDHWRLLINQQLVCTGLLHSYEFAERFADSGRMTVQCLLPDLPHGELLRLVRDA